MRTHFCVLSALNCHDAGPISLTYDEPDEAAELVQELTHEIAPRLEPDLSLAEVQTILEGTIQNFSDKWLDDYTGRKPYTHTWQDDNFYYTGVVIGREDFSSSKVELRRVENYNYDTGWWETLVIERENGKDVRIQELTHCGERKGLPFFCWERPYIYFKNWLRSSSMSIAKLDDAAFAERFFRVIDSDHDNCLHRHQSHALPCISYGEIEKTQYDGEIQELLRAARTGSTNIVTAIAAGLRGRDLWPALANDFGAWMITRPDIWPTLSLEPESSPCLMPLRPGSELTIFHTLPQELFLQILPLLPLHDLFSLQLLSHSVRTLVSPLLDETLWHHVHRGDFRWVLPVAEVKGEVKRANSVAMKWSPKALKDSALECVLDSKDFPFLSFIKKCLQDSDSMRNRQRLWGIAQQFQLLWEER
ncbi:hypothetical protein R3P38DRAFT_3119918, partial [Favolaschia claudopus]